MNKNPWTTKETLALGIVVYRNVFNNLNVIDRIENILSDKEDSEYKWTPSQVGFEKNILSIRDCADFKYKKINGSKNESEQKILIDNLWQDLYDVKFLAVQDYCKEYKIKELKYWEAMNFIKYGPGQYFIEHSDHGYNGSWTLSLVSYLNDNYAGGELHFILQDLKIKPKAGDLYLFPSNYIYRHAALPVISGVKYSIVTMLDYDNKTYPRKF